ncbi:MAG: hypothetical protein V2A65_01295, partial [Candidatus Omnitrophota bacterium]
ENQVPIDSSGLLQVRRQADLGDSLWATYNVVQENLMKGGMEGRSSYKGRQTTRKVKEIKSLVKDIDINQGLWNLACKYLN